MEKIYQKILVLNPDYHFKNDVDRIVMYSKKNVNFFSDSNWMSFIHPLQAMILNEFSKEKTLFEQYKVLSEMLGLSMGNVSDMMNPYIENNEAVYTEFKGNKILFPRNVLISKERLNCAREIECENNSELECSCIDLTPDRIHRGPHSMTFMVTNKCVTSCKYCYADRKTKYEPLSWDEIENIIEQARELKMTNVDVIGGELFCMPDWEKLIKKLVEYNMSPTFISTKCSISENSVRKLKETGYNDVVQISLDSLDDNVLSNLIGIKKGYVEKIKRTITYLEKNNFDIQIDTILTKLNTNHDSLKELYNYISGIKNLRYWELRVPEVSIYTPESFANIQAPFAQLEENFKFVKEEIIPNSKIKITFSDWALNRELRTAKSTDECFEGGPCGILKDGLFVLPDGKVSVCEQLYWHPQFIIGDLKTQSLTEIWNSPKAKALFAFNKSDYVDSSCSKCKALDFCNTKKRRCFVKVIKAYGKEHWNYPDPRCEFAPVINDGLMYK